MRGSGEVLISASAASAVRHHNALIRTREIVHQLVGFAIVENGPDWDLEHHIFTVSAGPVGSFAVSAASSFVFRIEAKMHQRIVALTGFHYDVATASAVTARGAAAGHKLLPPECNNPVAAVTGFHSNSGLIDKHQRSFDSKRWSSFPLIA